MLTGFRTRMQIEHYIRAVGHNLQINRRAMPGSNAPFMPQLFADKLQPKYCDKLGSARYHSAWHVRYTKSANR